jgi:drug/metabolite transporter (DMT)-like permease
VSVREAKNLSPPLRRGLELALVGVAAIWGATFVTVKDAVRHVPVFEFIAMRFLLAAILMSAVFWPQLRSLSRAGRLAGLLAGLTVFAGYSFQTTGLQYTRASNAGFVTGLFVVFAPLFAALFLKRLPSAGPLAGVGFAIVGLALLSLTHGLHVRYGDTIVLLAAVSFALQIVILARYAPEHSPAALVTVQMWVTAVLSVIVSAAFEDYRSPTSPDVWHGVLITGVLASALAFYVQTLAQRYVSPTRTAVILVSEPAFAGLFGIVLLNEALTVRGWVGAGLILAGMLVAELFPQRGGEG